MRSQPIEELDHMEEVQSGEDHFEYRSIRANHPKIRLVKEQILARLRQGQAI